MKGIQLFCLALLLAVTNGTISARAQMVIQPIQGCAIPKLDGDKVPFPLKTANTKFELAENETYLLNGYVVQQEGKPYFKIDFQSQPWLATYSRTQFPFVPVDADDPLVLAMPANQLVQMAVVVRREKAATGGHEYKDGLRFDLIVPPVKVLQP
jgi:hypothetical protein